LCRNVWYPRTISSVLRIYSSSKLDPRKKKSKCRISSSAHKAYGLENKIRHP
jgi:hypothetical protein